MPSSPSSHVTCILDSEGQHALPDRSDSGGPYVALCTYCPWRSEPLPTRDDTVRAASFHRLEANVREGNP